MKMYASQFQAIADALEQIFRDNRYADRVIADVLKADKRRGSKDRAFIAEQTYEVVRHYRLLSELAGGKPTNKSDWWKLVGISLLLRGEELPPWREFEGLEQTSLLAAYEKQRKNRAVFESVPDWLDKVGQAELQERWPASLTALNQPASVILRANTLKTTAEELQAKLLQEAEIETLLIGADALQVTKRKNLFRTDAFQHGYFEVQDFSSQQAAPALDVEPGMTVIDACAGAGGKTLHLAALMENKGTIISMDTEEWKLTELRRRAKRNNVQNVDTRAITGSKTIKRLHERADRLLLDVPCSGLGVLRRNPDAKWKLSPEFIDRLRGIQADILDRYSKMVKPGGKMVYATCSILPSENEAQLKKFLAGENGKEWKLTDYHTYLPQVEGHDGFFVSKLERKE